MSDTRWWYLACFVSGMLVGGVWKLTFVLTRIANTLDVLVTR